MKFLMNTGRTVRQGTFVEHKKHWEYADEASSCHMHPVDMMMLGIDDEGHVLVRGPSGMIVLRAYPLMNRSGVRYSFRWAPMPIT